MLPCIGIHTAAAQAVLYFCIACMHDHSEPECGVMQWIAVHAAAVDVTGCLPLIAEVAHIQVQY